MRGSGLGRLELVSQHVGGAAAGEACATPNVTKSRPAAEDFSDADRKLLGFVAPRLSPDDIASFHRQGYLVLPKVLTERGLVELRKEAQRQWDAVKGNTDVSLGTWLQAGLLTDIHHRSSLIRDFYWCGPVVDAARQLIGPNIKAATSQLTFKMPGMTKEVDWHQDNQYGHLSPYTTLSTLTALDDCTAANGAVVVVPGAHLGGQISLDGSPYDAKNAKASRDGSRVIKTEVDTGGVKQLELEAGQVLIMHCHMLHSSPPNLSDAPRRVLFQRYADADAVEVYNDGAPRLGRLCYGTTKFHEVEEFEATEASWRENVARSAEQTASREKARHQEKVQLAASE